MTREEFSGFLGKSIANALKGGVHQLEIVAALEAHKFNLQIMTWEQNKPRVIRTRAIAPPNGELGD
jgi:hypothetical protein